MLQAHDALYLLCNSFAMPKPLHLLRTSASWRARELLEDFDNGVREATQEICNIKLDDPVWTHASLPTSIGGLGIRRAADLALLAFLASTHATRELLSVLPEGEPAVDPLQEEAIGMCTEGVFKW